MKRTTMQRVKAIHDVLADYSEPERLSAYFGLLCAEARCSGMSWAELQALIATMTQELQDHEQSCATCRPPSQGFGSGPVGSA